ncbi:OLC1v1007935C1 [Oldenlandia corymbosa var. corymbosa]|uniref:OLC1v1007935C1 n=1 Tax=Oldenlandia corymbosa var. corymbosa TaxID=529605 RepID=A0AAV1DNM9_OLDCO|nr:OLC1v1007935C1 [Oldenlandia corymbosa var. corymbosa]
MTCFTPNSVTITLILIIRLWCGFVNSTPNTTIDKEVCSGGTYLAGDPYTNSVAYVLDEVMINTPYSPGYQYGVFSPFLNSPALGFGGCAQFLSPLECSSCMVAAFNEVLKRCCGYVSGAVILTDCSIGYKDIEPDL